MKTSQPSQPQPPKHKRRFNENWATGPHRYWPKTETRSRWEIFISGPILCRVPEELLAKRPEVRLWVKHHRDHTYIPEWVLREIDKQ